MKTEILKIKGDWQEVVDDCRATVGKESLGHDPSTKFKRAILIAEHSPIRDLIVKWRWPKMPHWVTVHWVRHKWECFVRTQRSDRTGNPREKLPQDEPQTFTGGSQRAAPDRYHAQAPVPAGISGDPGLCGRSQADDLYEGAGALRRPGTQLHLPVRLSGDVPLWVLA